MSDELKKILLRDKRVVDEINRHLWIESEKVEYDIGFDTAADDWIDNFAKSWLEYHAPKLLKKYASAINLRKTKPRKSVLDATKGVSVKNRLAKGKTKKLLG